MEVQVQELIDRVRAEGIEKAKEDAASIIKNAESEAAKIVSDAKRNAASILEEANKEKSRTEESGKAALEQAARNLLLSFRAQIAGELTKIVQKDVLASYTDNVLTELVVKIVTEWKSSDSDSLSVLLNPDALKRLEASFNAKLSAKIKAGLELKPFPAIKAGFRIEEKDGSAYYNFDANALSEMLCQYLNTELAKRMANAQAGI